MFFLTHMDIYYTLITPVAIVYDEKDVYKYVYVYKLMYYMHLQIVNTRRKYVHAASIVSSEYFRKENTSMGFYLTT